MSYERNIKWLNNHRIVYKQMPVSDKPDINHDKYMYFNSGTHQYYCLFNNPSKITTYKSLKWHFLVIFYLNENIKLKDIFRFIANKENGFVTFFIKNKILENMIEDVIRQGGEPPVNRLRKIIFKDYNGLSFEDKMQVVGQLSGRSSHIDEETIYQCMLELNDSNKNITNSNLASLLKCSIRTIQRHMCAELKQEKQILNEKI